MENKIILLVLISLIKISSGYHGVNDDNNPYRNKQVLDNDGKFFLEWEVDWERSLVHFNVTVATVGFVGLGLSKKGKMAGADIVIGGVDRNGRPYFGDYQGVEGKAPVKDESQDWTLHSAWESSSHTFLSFSRKIETCDDQDLPITDDVLALIWAYGESDKEAEYHHGNRGVFDAYLLDPNLIPSEITELSYKNVTEQVPLDSLGEWKVWRVPMEQELLPQDTSYMCTFHKLPSEKGKQHIVGFRTILNTELERTHIHHFLVYGCRPPAGVDPDEFFGPYAGQPGKECYVLTAPNYDIPNDYCREVRHAWAVGAGPLFLPEHVGLPLNFETSEYYMIQLHFDNPKSLPNIKLQFSLETYYTDKLREYDAGIITVGVANPRAPSIMIPPASLNHVVYGHCAADCTRKMFPKTGVNVFAAKLHTHLAGIGTRYLHIQNNRILPLLIDDNYNFNFQPTRILQTERTVLPGDMLLKRCVYETADRGRNATIGGLSTRNEMCNSFIYYYPYITTDVYGFCTSEIRSNAYRELLQINNVTWSDETREYMVTSPESNAGQRVSQVGTNIDWTIEKRRKLQEFHNFLPQISGCPGVVPYLNRTILPRGNSRALYNTRNDNDEFTQEIRDASSEFVSVLRKDLVPYVRTSTCKR